RRIRVWQGSPDHAAERAIPFRAAGAGGGPDDDAARGRADQPRGVLQHGPNITTCVWSGITRDEVFDVRPYAQRLAYGLLRQKLTQNLPRKFKIAFDGCGH